MTTQLGEVAGLSVLQTSVYKPDTQDIRHGKPRCKLPSRLDKWSRLGLEYQRHAIARFCDAEGIKLAGEFVEVETGKGANALIDRRPKLAAALEAARKAKAPVVVTQLDRLSRDVAFIAALMARRVPFVVRRTGHGC